MSDSLENRGGATRGPIATWLRKWLVWIIAPAVLLLIILALIGSSESFESCIKQRKYHHAYQALHEEGPLFIRAIVRLELHAACARVTAGQNDGAITALATITLTFFTFALWRATREITAVSARQHDEMQKSTVVAKNAADAATRSAKVSEDALILTQRAFLSLKEIRAEPMKFAASGEEIMAWAVIAKWENVGNTPALKCMAAIGWGDYGPNEKVSYPFSANPPDTALSLPVGPRISFDSNTVRIGKAHLLQVQQGTRTILITGQVFYNDAFDGTPQHETRFCSKIVVHGDLERNPNPLSFHAMSEDNYST